MQARIGDSTIVCFEIPHSEFNIPNSWTLEMEVGAEWGSFMEE